MILEITSPTKCVKDVTGEKLVSGQRDPYCYHLCYETLLRHWTLCPTFKGFLTDIPLCFAGHSVYNLFFLKSFHRTSCPTCSGNSADIVVNRRTCPDVQRLFIFVCILTVFHHGIRDIISAIMCILFFFLF